MTQAVETEARVSVRIPTVLRKFTDNSAEVSIAGGTVLSAIRDLTSKYRSLESHLFDAEGSLRSFVNIYVNDEDVRYLDGYDTVLKEGDQLAIIPAVAGG
jgi:molybdopterin synthase sulfur carrier subunit